MDFMRFMNKKKYLQFSIFFLILIILFIFLIGNIFETNIEYKEFKSIVIAEEDQLFLSLLITACDDGIDNDNDGLIDWQEDLGCYNGQDSTEGGSLGKSLDNGWTVFEESSAGDTRIYYVSSGGDDRAGANDCTDITDPCKTVSHGYNQLRDGKADWLLLKRGDVFDMSSSQVLLDISGKSAIEPIVISAYGNDSERPLIKNGGFSYDNSPSAGIKNFAFVSLIFYGSKDDPASSDFTLTNEGDVPVSFLIWGLSSNILIEDSFFNFTNSISIQERSNGKPKDWTVRRNVILYNDRAGSNFWHVNNLLLEENVYYHNGWYNGTYNAPGCIPAGQDPYVPGCEHNIYSGQLSNSTIRNNIFISGSNTNLKSRSDITKGYRDNLIENNLFIRGQYHITFDDDNGSPGYTQYNVTVKDNVFTEIGHGVLGNALRSINFASSELVTVENNYFIHNTEISSPPSPIYFHPSSENSINITIRNNHMFDYGPNGFIDNSDNSIYTAPECSNLSVDPDCTKADANYINLQSSDYVDSDRNIGSYYDFVEGTTEGDVDDFIGKAISQTRTNWNNSYTASAVNDYIRAGFSFVSQTCGDGVVDPPLEECDGTNLSGQTCVTQGFDGGTLNCTSSCQFDTSLCTITPTQCNDLIDNDGDGWTDLTDPGCSTSADNTESGNNNGFECGDEVDNADPEDTLVDGNDPDCLSPSDSSETADIGPSVPTVSFIGNTPTNGSTVSEGSFSVELQSNSDDNDHYAFVNFDNSIVSWHRFEGNFLDEINNNDGTANSVTTVSGSRYDSGADFNAVGDYIQIPTTGFDLESFTISAWAKADGFRSLSAGPQYIFGHSSTINDFTDTIQIYTDDTAGLLDIGLNSHPTASAIFDLAVNTWYHIVLVVDDTNYEVYVNGVLKANGDYTLGGASALSTLRGFADIGNDGSGTRNEGWDGIIDEFIIFDRALTASEVTSLYDATVNQYNKTFSDLSDRDYVFTGYAVNDAGVSNTGSRTVTVTGNGSTITTGFNLLHLGHSLIGFDMPLMFGQVSIDGGFTDHIYNLNLVTATEPAGANPSLEYKWNNPDTIRTNVPFSDPPNNLNVNWSEELANGNNDIFILTEQMPYDFVSGDTAYYVGLFYNYSVFNNPDIRLYLYETWAQNDQPNFATWRQDIDDKLPEWEAVMDEVNTNYSSLGAEQMYIIPAGQVFARLYDELQNNPGDFTDIDADEIGEYFADGIHMNALGSYYISLVHYATIYKKSPVGLTSDIVAPSGGFQRGPYNRPDATTTQKLQELAWDVVINYSMSGVNISTIEGFPGTCGDDLVQSPNNNGEYERCDGTDLNNTDCIDLGFDSGTLSCTSSCLFDNSLCINSEDSGNSGGNTDGGSSGSSGGSLSNFISGTGEIYGNDSEIVNDSDEGNTETDSVSGVNNDDLKSITGGAISEIDGKGKNSLVIIIFAIVLIIIFLVVVFPRSLHMHR